MLIILKVNKNNKYMKHQILQFGIPSKCTKDRPSIYAIIIKNNMILVAEVNGVNHLPGGGKEKEMDDIDQLILEIEQETGYIAKVTEFVGKANQYTTHRTLGPVNKLGDFYIAEIISKKGNQQDKDHIPKWIPIESYLSGPGLESHKWAVKQSLV